VDSQAARLNTFQESSRDGSARTGVFHTAHGAILTPTFMPVGTQATVKALSPAEVADTGARMLIANTYHLWLRPGAELVAEMGGLHQFMAWPHAIATDSGGFQAFSLASRVKLSEAGFEFASHLDGSRRLLSPEESMRAQGLLGSDIALQLDVCPEGNSPIEVLTQAVERTTRWAERCLTVKRPGQALFGIVQGGTQLDLRLRHAEQLAALPLDGIALGGFSVGEANEAMHATLERLVPHVDPRRPHYLMGVGTPADLVRAIGTGVDVFDCVIPTRNARNGQVFTSAGKLSIRNAQHRHDPRPLDVMCECSTCMGGFSRAYIRHLFIAGEILAHRLLTLHNLHYYARLIQEARLAIAKGCYADWANARLRIELPQGTAVADTSVSVPAAAEESSEDPA
jgi:queuine tRNA-ribosyltransferase